MATSSRHPKIGESHQRTSSAVTSIYEPEAFAVSDSHAKAPEPETTPLLDADRAPEDIVDPVSKGFRLVVMRYAPVLFVFFMAGISTVAARDQLIIGWICEGLYPTTDPPSRDSAVQPPVDRCNSSAVQSLSSQWLVILSLCYNLPAAFVVPVYGWLSDRGWRKRVLFFPVMGSLIEKLSVICLSFPLDRSLRPIDGIPSHILPTLCLGTFINGLLGSYPVAMLSAFAALADATPPAGRTLNIARMEAVFMGAFALGPLIGGALVRLADSVSSPTSSSSFFTSFEGYRANFAPFWLAGLADIIVLVALRMAVPEISPSVSKRTVVVLEDELAESGASTVTLIRTEVNEGEGRFTRWKRTVSSALWGENRDRTMLATVLVLFFCKFQGTKFVRVFKKVDGIDVLLVRVGVCALVAAQVMYAFAWNGWIFFSVAALIDSPAFALLTPAIRSLLSSATPPTHQARLFSLVSLVENLFGVVSPAVFGVIYAELVQMRSENAIYLVFAAMLLLGAVITMFVRRDMVERSREAWLAEDYERIDDAGE
ncbi:hypothetical protein HDU93_005994 [Gonapodya sp. JEL0774]|nr:hypothetical protein HDU93_005994 [Gonapodya sp. JEL0774]